MRYIVVLVLIGSPLLSSAQYYVKVGYNQLIFRNDRIIIGNGILLEVGIRSKLVERHTYSSLGLGVVFLPETQTLALKEIGSSELELIKLPRTIMYPIKLKSEINLIEKDKFDWYLGAGVNYYLASEYTYLGKLGVSIHNSMYYRINRKLYIWFNPEISYNFGFTKDNYWARYKGFVFYTQIGIGWRFKHY